jgi:hypothetical protein
MNRRTLALLGLGSLMLAGLAFLLWSDAEEEEVGRPAACEGSRTMRSSERGR